ncbi:hypothetical protein [Micromonospora parathelypteridis]|uniref:DUF6311 domain-containing protein n=1 Tax=Micromonospora parathelypteridis TaxID=1839617 RepID=A0A840VRT4_9ACTN|nr:hypothetical protein [Micromonospora parathelypteridis]MBB5479832.1 hypothetical protein [Micromonospora parathelypteridis]GGO26305.1 glycosyl transferase [Micromonospora parathelypteridis]
MTTGTTSPVTSPPAEARAARPAWLSDVLVVAGYLGLAAVLTSAQWGHPWRLFHQAGDQVLFEWMLAHAAHALVEGENPLYGAGLNAPDGVNLMANTSVLGLGIPLAPVTLLFGSQVAFCVAVVCCLAGTAAAWYALLRRRLVTTRSAAAVGGLICGFAPGMIAQAGAHLHIAAQFLVPAILALVFRPASNPAHRPDGLGRPDGVRRPDGPGRADGVWRPGVGLGLLLVWQVFIGEEVLVFLALAAGVFALGYAIADRAAARRLAPALFGRLAVAAGVAAVPLAYPLWFQFYGPQHYSGMAFATSGFQLDAASFTASARQTVLGDDWLPGLLSPNPTEENSFFGPGLLGLAVVIVIWQWRRPLVRALAGCGVVFALLSLGTELRVDGTATGIPGPYRLVAGLPLLDLAVPARFALVCVPVLGVLVALSLDRVRTARGPATAPGLPVRLLWAGAVAAALLPLVPTPIRVVPVAPVPAFVADGGWRPLVPPGRTVVALPPVTGAGRSAVMLWSARTGLAFPAPGGYFIGPSGPDDPAARWGAPDRPTSVLLRRVADSGVVPVLTDADRSQAVADLRHWRAAVVVLGWLEHGDPVRRTVDDLLGPGRPVDGGWVWDVRDRVG